MLHDIFIARHQKINFNIIQLPMSGYYLLFGIYTAWHQYSVRFIECMVPINHFDYYVFHLFSWHSILLVDTFSHMKLKVGSCMTKVKSKFGSHLKLHRETGT